MFLLSLRSICVSLATNFVAGYTVSEKANWETSKRHVTSENFARDMSPSLARPLLCTAKKGYKNLLNNS